MKHQYESECVKSWIEEAEGAYPKLCDYESEWLKYISILDDTGGGEDPEPPIGEFPYIVLSDVTAATIDNVVPYAYKSASLKGSTKYRDIDTGDILDTFDETKNLELVSVEMPVLKTTGKNLFNKKDVEFNYVVGNNNPISKDYVSSNFIEVKPSTQYAINNSLPVVYGFDINKKMIGAIKGYSGSGTFKTPNNCYFIRIRNYYQTTDHQPLIDAAQLEMGSSATSYEPYKSNILTVNEDVTLRGIGDVKDELDLLTGELTERIGEVVLDENSTKNFTLSAISNNTVSFWCVHNASSPFVNISRGEDLKTLLCDKIPRKSNFNEDVELIHSGTGAVVLRILKNKLQTLDVNGLTLYLQSNPITVQYQLAPESVRTVDLNIQDQNGKTLSVIKPIEGKMLLTTSSDTIKPLFSGEIPVEAITQNLASFIDLEMEE